MKSSTDRLSVLDVPGLVLLGSTLLVLGAVRVHAQQNTPPELAQAFTDDFADGLSSQYRTKGKPEWSPERVLLPPQSAISRRLSAGSWVELAVEFTPAAAQSQDEGRDFNIGIESAAGSSCIVNFRIVDGDGAPCVISLMEAAPQSVLSALARPPSNKLIRSSRSPVLPERLTVSYRQGQVRVSDGSTDLLVGFVPRGASAPVSGFRLESKDGALAIQSLTLNATSNPFARLTNEDRDRLNEASRLNRDSKAAFFRGRADLEQTIAAVETIREIHRDVLGEFHEFHASALDNLASLYTLLFQQERALEYGLRSLRIRQALCGENHLLVSRTLHAVAEVHERLGNYDQVLKAYEEASGIELSVLGKDHEQHSTTLIKIAAAYSRLGEHHRAEPLLREATQARLAQSGKHTLRYAIALNHLGSCYLEMGDYVQAEHHLREAYAIVLELDAAPVVRKLTILNNLARLMKRMERMEEASQFYAEAQAILDDHKLPLGIETSILNNIATHRIDVNDLDEAIALLTSIVEARKRELGEEHHLTGASLSNLANAYHRRGDFEKGAELFPRAIALLESSIGTEHPQYGVTITNQALAFADTGRYSDARDLFSRASTTKRIRLDRAAVVQSERQQRRNQQTERHLLDGELSTALRLSEHATAAIESVWRWKGAITQRQRAFREVGDNPTLAAQFTELQRVTRALSALVTQTPVAPGVQASAQKKMQFEATVSRWRARFSELTQEREAIEKEISASSEAFRKARQVLSVEDVRATLPPKTVLVDFIQYGQLLEFEVGPKAQFQQRFLACVVSPESAPALVQLGIADEIRADIESFRVPFLKPNASREERHAAADAGQRLKRALWEPLHDHLGDAESVIVCPDTVLGKLPFAALPGRSPDRYLIEDLKLIHIPYAQLLPSMDDRQDAPRLLVVGDIDYDSSPASSAAEERSAASRADQGRVKRNAPSLWQPLPGFQDELKIVSDTHRRRFGANSQIEQLSRSDATKASFLKQSAQANAIHVVTHGFFAGPTSITSGQQSVDAAGPSWRADQLLTASVPGLLSGLVMAGANSEPGSPSSDGILRASEIESGHMKSVDLVVLSACQTALGTTAGGEGLTGLQRAFHIAGARTVVASLWNVEDRSTQALMERFYSNLWIKKMNTVDALRESQLWMLRHPGKLAAMGVRDVETRGSIRKLKPQTPTETTAGRTDPFFWAAFQVSGDWR